MVLMGKVSRWSPVKVVFTADSTNRDVAQFAQYAAPRPCEIRASDVPPGASGACVFTLPTGSQKYFVRYRLRRGDCGRITVVQGMAILVTDRVCDDGEVWTFEVE